MREVIAKHKPAIMPEFCAPRYRNPAKFFNELTSIYGNVKAINFNAKLEDVSVDMILNTRYGEDWLLLLAPN